MCQVTLSRRDSCEQLQTLYSPSRITQGPGHRSVSDPMWLYGLQPTRLLPPWNSPGKSTGVGCHFLLQGIFQTQGSNWSLLHLLHWQVYSLPLSFLGNPFVSLSVSQFLSKIPAVFKVCFKDAITNLEVSITESTSAVWRFVFLGRPISNSDHTGIGGVLSPSVQSVLFADNSSSVKEREKKHQSPHCVTVSNEVGSPERWPSDSEQNSPQRRIRAILSNAVTGKSTQTPYFEDQHLLRCVNASDCCSVF